MVDSLRLIVHTAVAALATSGWVTFRVRTEHDLPAAIDLLRMNYERLRGLQARANVLPIVGKVSMVGDHDPELPTS